MIGRRRERLQLFEQWFDVDVAESVFKLPEEPIERDE